ncbi:MAG: hypothetical protein HUJ26_17360 [Planctomycetaceae bacterium]|nr:hypothetical protein [Planctomycetaceae bacterium]
MKLYKVEGQVSEITYQMQDGFRQVFKFFGSDDAFTLNEGMVNVEMGSVIECLISSVDKNRWQIHQLKIAEDVAYASPAFIASQNNLLCTSNDDSIEFRAVISEIKK